MVDSSLSDNERVRTAGPVRRRLKLCLDLLVPGPRARLGASLGVIFVYLSVFGLVGSQLGSGLGLPIDLAGSIAFAFLVLGVYTGLIRAAVWFVKSAHIGLRPVGVGAMGAIMILGLKWQLGWAVIVGVITLEALSFGALLMIGSREFWRARWVYKTFILSIVVFGVSSNLELISWMRNAGDGTYALETSTVPVKNSSTDVSDPSIPGTNTVHKFTYGSGTDKRRPQFAEGALIHTESVDARPFLRGFSWWDQRFREWYWGFNSQSYPRNGTVWYPEGSGPFPLVLMVHGNHYMSESSDRGYAYLGELLASRGFIFVSVDQNFLNRSPIGQIPDQIDARAWVLLQHLGMWGKWNSTDGHLFRGKVDFERVGLIGHSSGGEAVALAGALNRLQYHPNDAKLQFDLGFSIKALIALAPTDGVVQSADRLTPLRDLSYLVLQGSHDADVSSFVGDRQYNRARFTHPGEAFKASVYIHRANHSQFNTDWGRHDLLPPLRWMLNTKPLLAGKEQQRIAKVFISAFVEATLNNDVRYRKLFRDHRLAQHWLPETLYVTRYEDPSFRLLADFEEDLDITTPSVRGGSLTGLGLTVWREQDVKLRNGERRRNNAVVLGWKRLELEQKEPATSDSVPTFTLVLPQGLARDWRLKPSSVLVWQMAQSIDESESLPAEKLRELESGTRDNAIQGPRSALDLTVELVLADGTRVALPFAKFRPLPLPILVRFTKLEILDRKRYHQGHEPTFQTFEIPLRAFMDSGGDFDPTQLRAVRFRFDRSPKGLIFLDDIGFADG